MNPTDHYHAIAYTLFPELKETGFFDNGPQFTAIGMKCFLLEEDALTSEQTEAVKKMKALLQHVSRQGVLPEASI